LAGSVIALGFGGCVTTHVQQPLAAGVPAGGTAVTVSITANTDQVSGLSQITIGRLNSGDALSGLILQSYVLTQVAKDMARDTTLFIGTLPPGQYYFSKLTEGKNANRYIQLRAGLDAFTVEEGKPVDLGRLIVTPLSGQRVLVGRSLRVRDNRVLIERYSPEHLKLFAPEATISWSAPRKDMDRAEEVAMARPTSAQCVTELADGSVAAATRMGTVLWRSPQGTWRKLPSDQIESLNCVQSVRMPDADLLAFGEFGTLLRHAPEQNKLESVDTGNLPYGNLIALAGNVDAGWYIAVQRNNEVTIYHSARLERGDWSKVRSERMQTSIFNPDSWFWMRDIGTGFAYTTPAGTLEVYDYASGQWSQRATPKGRLAAFRTSDSGLWSSTAGGSGPFSQGAKNSFVSLDQGRSWQQVQVSIAASHIPLVQRADGAWLRFEGSLMGKTSLQASTDMGKTWTLLDGEPKSRELTPLKSGAILGQIWDLSEPARFEISTDGGKSWTAESVK
jgi:hypothetical protein